MVLRPSIPSFTPSDHPSAQANTAIRTSMPGCYRNDPVPSAQCCVSARWFRIQERQPLGIRP